MVQCRRHPFHSSASNACVRIGNKTKRPEEDSHSFDPLGLISPAIIKGNYVASNVVE